MKKWLKRIRGALGMGLTWAAGWSGVFVILALVGEVSGTFGVLNYVNSVVLFGMVGFVGGAAFSVVLGITEGRRRSGRPMVARSTTSSRTRAIRAVF